MALSTLWWIACGAAVIVELLTGTFYLLMLGVSMAAAAVAAHLGADAVSQLIFAAVVGGFAIGALYVKRSKSPATLRASMNKDVNLDIGETVHVLQWDADRTCTVHYRGADWQASLTADTEAQTGPHRIVEMLGSRLILQPIQ